MMDENEKVQDKTKPHLKRLGVGSYEVHNLKSGIAYTFNADGRLKAQAKMDPAPSPKTPTKARSE